MQDFWGYTPLHLLLACAGGAFPAEPHPPHIRHRLTEALLCLLRAGARADTATVRGDAAARAGGALGAACLAHAAAILAGAAALDPLDADTDDGGAAAAAGGGEEDEAAAARLATGMSGFGDVPVVDAAAARAAAANGAAQMHAASDAVQPVRIVAEGATASVVAGPDEPAADDVPAALRADSGAADARRGVAGALDAQVADEAAVEEEAAGQGDAGAGQQADAEVLDTLGSVGATGESELEMAGVESSVTSEHAGAAGDPGNADSGRDGEEAAQGTE